MVQLVKNLTAAAWAAAEAWVPYPAWCSGLNDLWHRSQLQLRFSPWPGNFHILWVWPLKKKKFWKIENEMAQFICDVSIITDLKCTIRWVMTRTYSVYPIH